MDQIDMNEIVGKCHILFVCLDSLRYDAALEEQERGGTPVLNRYGKWRKCQAPGNFTYPSHQAMFAGFLPIDDGVRDMKKRENCFSLKISAWGAKRPREPIRLRERRSWRDSGGLGTRRIVSAVSVFLISARMWEK